MGIALFIVSTAFPIFASLLPTEPSPSWVGVLDVILAFVLVLCMFWIDARGRSQVNDQTRQQAYQVYRVLGHFFLLLLLLFFIIGEAISWQVLLPGLAWRFWLFFYTLPSLLALWGENISDDSRTS